MPLFREDELTLAAFKLGFGDRYLTGTLIPIVPDAALAADNQEN